MARLQRFLAIPMAATVVAGLWLLWRQGGNGAFLFAAFAAAALALCLYFTGRIQRQGRPQARFAALLALVVVVMAVARVPAVPVTQPAAASAAAWSEARVEAELAAGHPVFVYFTADWCLTCKANEVTSINREEVRQAFKAAGVTMLVGDWTNGDRAITRFLDSRGRAGVPLYLWYEPGGAVEELPQILTPSMLTSRARRPRQQ
jgi:thiol:disulfide interchange protein